MNVNTPMCSSRHQNQATFCGFCPPCLEIWLSSPLPAQVNSSSGSILVEPASPIVNSFNQNNSLTSASYPQPPNHPAYANNQSNNQDSNLSSSFDARVFKHAAAKVAAHNNAVQYPASIPNNMMYQPSTAMAYQQFDALAAAKENRTCTSPVFPVGKAKHTCGWSLGTAMS
ncbi:uncharacterized protein MELLADRAFT_101713 [Melampsora larici-populina 98AG31]|uniref:Uncharacterized protein n=1 Tax=Melampsora larici-populina (strain 98AG31 / pathotype 3-4-7) TaxID=747676 RepID=F4R6Q6_MELLP|nr:uncharacterized protein MELLADRAFT_101713 [Melampsora larici-populina 98AG31]EGG12419.1 hypothetical protein MELLADRAFT_101713 [Melampsora larici-populina 98AG31]